MRTHTLLTTLSVALLMTGGCGYGYDGNPGSTGLNITSLDEALSIAQQADANAVRYTGQVLAAGEAMEIAEAVFEADLAAAEAGASVPALRAAVDAALIAILDADAAAVAGNEIGVNLVLMGDAVAATARLLPDRPGEREKAEAVLLLAADAEEKADAAFNALDVAFEGLEGLIEGLEEAEGVAGDLGQPALAAQLEAEIAQAEIAEVLVEGAEGAIENGEAIIDAAVEVLDAVILGL